MFAVDVLQFILGDGTHGRSYWVVVREITFLEKKGNALSVSLVKFKDDTERLMMVAYLTALLL